MLVNLWQSLRSVDLLVMHHKSVRVFSPFPSSDINRFVTE
jgi:hypothetical protein